MVAILALQIVATPIAFAGHLRPVDISTDKDQNSVTGDPISITFSFMYYGKTISVTVNIPQGNAYVAVAGVIWGLYDLYNGRYASFSSDGDKRIKNHDGFGCDYIFNLDKIYDSKLKLHKHNNGWLHVYRNYTIVGYFEKKGPLCFDAKIKVYVHIFPEAYIAPGYY